MYTEFHWSRINTRREVYISLWNIRKGLDVNVNNQSNEHNYKDTNPQDLLKSVNRYNQIPMMMMTTNDVSICANKQVILWGHSTKTVEPV